MFFFNPSQTNPTQPTKNQQNPRLETRLPVYVHTLISFSLSFFFRELDDLGCDIQRLQDNFYFFFFQDCSRVRPSHGSNLSWPARFENLLPRPDPTRPDPTRPDPSRPVPTRPNPSRPVPTRPDPTRLDPSRPDPTRPNPSRPVPTRPAICLTPPNSASLDPRDFHGLQI